MANKVDPRIIQVLYFFHTAPEDTRRANRLMSQKVCRQLKCETREANDLVTQVQTENLAFSTHQYGRVWFDLTPKGLKILKDAKLIKAETEKAEPASETVEEPVEDTALAETIEQPSLVELTDAEVCDAIVEIVANAPKGAFVDREDLIDGLARSLELPRDRIAFNYFAPTADGRLVRIREGGKLIGFKVSGSSFELESAQIPLASDQSGSDQSDSPTYSDREINDCCDQILALLSDAPFVARDRLRLYRKVATAVGVMSDLAELAIERLIDKKLIKIEAEANSVELSLRTQDEDEADLESTEDDEDEAETEEESAVTDDEPTDAGLQQLTVQGCADQLLAHLQTHGPISAPGWRNRLDERVAELLGCTSVMAKAAIDKLIYDGQAQLTIGAGRLTLKATSYRASAYDLEDDASELDEEEGGALEPALEYDQAADDLDDDEPEAADQDEVTTTVFGPPEPEPVTLAEPEREDQEELAMATELTEPQLRGLVVIWAHHDKAAEQAVVAEAVGLDLDDAKKQVIRPLENRNFIGRKGTRFEARSAGDKYAQDHLPDIGKIVRELEAGGFLSKAQSNGSKVPPPPPPRRPAPAPAPAAKPSDSAPKATNQYKVLVLLVDSGETLKTTVLGERAGIPKGSVSGLMIQLYSAKLVSRNAEPDRSHSYAATAKAQRHLEQHPQETAAARAALGLAATSTPAAAQPVRAPQAEPAPPVPVDEVVYPPMAASWLAAREAFASTHEVALEDLQATINAAWSQQFEDMQRALDAAQDELKSAQEAVAAKDQELAAKGAQIETLKAELESERQTRQGAQEQLRAETEAHQNLKVSLRQLVPPSS